MKVLKTITLSQLIVSLVVVVGILIGGFLIINPGRKLVEYRDQQRQQDVEKILGAVKQFVVENNGALPTGLTTGMTEKQIGRAASGCTIQSGSCTIAHDGCINLGSSLENYLGELPVDPQGDFERTGYTISVAIDNIVTIRACKPEGMHSISVSR